MIAQLLAAALVVGPVAADDLFTLQDPQISESSAVVEVGRGPSSRVLTINDSGDGPVVYVIDPRTGRTVGHSTYAGDAVDVEALTRGRGGSIWVGDIGDNGGQRTSIQAYRLPALRDGDREVPSMRYDLVYPGGPRDAETLLVDPRSGRLFVVSKGFFGGTVYAAPRRLRADRPNRLTPVGEAPGVVTDGAFFRDARHVVLRDYSRAYFFDSARLPWRRLDGFALPDQPQGEGVDVRPGGRSLLISSEGVGEPVQAVSIPRRILRELRPPQPGTDATPAPGQDQQPRSRLDALGQTGNVPWTLVGLVVGTCTLVGWGFRLRRLRAGRRRGRSRP